MKIKSVITASVVILCIILSLSACGGSAAHVGKYTKGEMYINLNSDGTFEADNYVNLKGKYRVNGSEVNFEVTELNGKKISNKTKGKLEGKELTGPDGFKYTKE
ncbi:MAG: hypothetical protein N3B21_05085 [Clostridia bacterium]|nr:hypothetical protein [Clostridia bacterium]